MTRRKNAPVRTTATRPRAAAAASDAGRRRSATAGSRVKRPRPRRPSEPEVKPLRWNPDPDDVRRSVVQLVLTLVELLRRLMERQAIRRMDDRTLTPAEIDAIGKALRELEATIGEIAKTFDLSLEDLNLNLGNIDLM
jgi:hypothetical protein